MFRVNRLILKLILVVLFIMYTNFDVNDIVPALVDLILPGYGSWFSAGMIATFFI